MENANENTRYVHAPFIDRWAVYDRTKNQGESVLCLTLSEEKAKRITELLNLSTVTVNDTLDLADKKLFGLKSQNLSVCDPDDCESWDWAVEACRDELKKMRV